ncbi:bacteriocin [Legionella tunisiensis]|uniref:bacteriocin n=1 Tax=Legionella tunisiensis TaxID=1034944 RepID=UPI000317A8B6|nr:bacteriocin [Legionella tunisiensis]
MTESKERVFAYTLAKTIDNDELAKVSGGYAATTTHSETVRATGGSGQGVDVLYDQSIDW